MREVDESECVHTQRNLPRRLFLPRKTLGRGNRTAFDAVNFPVFATVEELQIDQKFDEHEPLNFSPSYTKRTEGECAHAEDDEIELVEVIKIFWDMTHHISTRACDKFLDGLPKNVFAVENFLERFQKGVILKFLIDAKS